MYCKPRTGCFCRGGNQASTRSSDKWYWIILAWLTLSPPVLLVLIAHPAFIDNFDIPARIIAVAFLTFLSVIGTFADIVIICWRFVIPGSRNF